MKQWMTCKEASKKWNLGEHWISILCKSGSIAGAKKDGRQWCIPIDAVPPIDKRVKECNYIKNTDSKWSRMELHSSFVMGLHSAESR